MTFVTSEVAHTPAGLPAPRDPAGPYRVGVICLGNICRSPIGEVVLRRTLERAGLGDRVVVDSGGTGDWHVGQAMDARASEALSRAGYDGSAHRARQVVESWFDDHDLLLAMDRGNYRALLRLGPAIAAERLRMFREFDPQAGENLDLPDPYGGGSREFADVLAVVERTAAVLAQRLAAKLD
jgi:protein-tyrosine phosphatase